MSRKDVASVIKKTAVAVCAQVRSVGKFATVTQAADAVAASMTVASRPQFSANETAKDFFYIGKLLEESAAHHCKFGPGALAGLTIVRKQIKRLPKTNHAAAAELCKLLRKKPTLEWMQAIDVEQALCEFAKYEKYRMEGISAGKMYVEKC